MEPEQSACHTLTTVFSDTKEQLVECDLVLPDYYPEISKILRCEVNPSREATTLTAEKLSIAGNVNVKMMYKDSEEKVHIFSYDSKYTKVLNVGKSETQDICKIKQTVNSVNCRATAPRKAEIRIFLAITADIQRMKEISFLTDSPFQGDIQIKSATCDLLYPTAFGTVDVQYSDRVNMPTNEAPAFINATLKNIEFTEIKTVKNKLMLKGNIVFVPEVFSEKGNLSVGTKVSVPFTDIAELYGCLDNDLCEFTLEDLNITITPLGDDNQCDVSVKFSGYAFSYHPSQIRLIEDAYGIHRNTNLNSSAFLSIREIQSVNEAFTLEGNVGLPTQSKTAQIIPCVTGGIAYAVNRENGTVSVNGRIPTVLVIKNQADEYASVTADISFDEPLPVGMENEALSLSLTVTENNFTAVSDTQINYRITLQVKGYAIVNEKMNAVTHLEIQEETAVSSPKVILYYADTGESVWDIAKSNKGICSEIETLNQISGDILTQPKTLVFSGF